MGSGAIDDLIKKTDDRKLANVLSDQLQQYQAAESEVLNQLHKLDKRPQDTGGMAKMMSRAGIKLNTALDSSPSHLAEMVIQGSTMGITDLTGALKNSGSASKEVRDLCSSIIHEEQQNIEKMKSFL